MAYFYFLLFWWMISKSIKIWFFSLLFFLLAGCWKQVSNVYQRDEVLHYRFNQMISLLNSAFQLERSEFQGLFSWEASFGQQISLLNLSGNLAFLSGDFWGKLSFSGQQIGGISNLSQALKGKFLLRKSAVSYYFYPEELEIVGRAWNIQLKFLQLMLHGMRGNRFQWENNFFFSEQWFSGFPELPQLFSGEKIFVDRLQNFLFQLAPDLSFSTGSLERNENADWIFKDWRCEYKGEIFEFSWSFDGKHFLWNIQRWDQLPWNFELTFEKNQLFFNFSRGITSFTLQLKKLKNSEFSLGVQFWNLQKKDEKIAIQALFSRRETTSPLQTPPNNYISLVQYLESLNIAF